jgi:hypothetical protein
MSRKFGAPSIPAGAPPSGFNLVQLGSVAIGSAASDNVDNAVGINVARVLAELAYFNPSTALWERARVGAIVLKSVTVFNAGDNAVWTPAAGKKFRLFAAQMILNGSCAIAVAAVLNLTLKDAGNFGLPAADVWVPNAAGTTPDLYVGPWLTFGPNGYLSLLANNVLNLNLGVALTVGACRVNTIGVEE